MNSSNNKSSYYIRSLTLVSLIVFIAATSIPLYRVHDTNLSNRERNNSLAVFMGIAIFSMASTLVLLLTLVVDNTNKQRFAPKVVFLPMILVSITITWLLTQMTSYSNSDNSVVTVEVNSLAKTTNYVTYFTLVVSFFAMFLGNPVGEKQLTK